MWLHSNPRFLEAGGGLARRRVENLKELDTKVKINLKGLKPNYIYAARFYLWTDYGKGPASEEYLLKTLPSDPPSLVNLISASPNSLSLSWSRPNNIAINVTLDEIYWKITKNQEEISNGNIANGTYPMQVEINSLQPAENFLFHVKTKSSEIKVKLSNPIHQTPSLKLFCTVLLLW